jgi:hypothetical protein
MISLRVWFVATSALTLVAGFEASSARTAEPRAERVSRADQERLRGGAVPCSDTVGNLNIPCAGCPNVMPPGLCGPAPGMNGVCVSVTTQLNNNCLFKANSGTDCTATVGNNACGTQNFGVVNMNGVCVNCPGAPQGCGANLAQVTINGCP